MSQNERFAVFFGIWVVLGVSSFLFFTFNKDAPLKRRAHRFFIILVGVLFVIFTAWVLGSTQVLGFIIPVVSIIMSLNLITTKFCDSCGSTLYNANWFTRMEYCPKCGVKLGGRSVSVAGETDDQQSRAEVERLACSMCGYQNPIVWHTCQKCKARLR